MFFIKFFKDKKDSNNNNNYKLPKYVIHQIISFIIDEDIYLGKKFLNLQLHLYENRFKLSNVLKLSLISKDVKDYIYNVVIKEIRFKWNISNLKELSKRSIECFSPINFIKILYHLPTQPSLYTSDFLYGIETLEFSNSVYSIDLDYILPFIPNILKIKAPSIYFSKKYIPILQSNNKRLIKINILAQRSVQSISYFDSFVDFLKNNKSIQSVKLNYLTINTADLIEIVNKIREINKFKFSYSFINSMQGYNVNNNHQKKIIFADGTNRINREYLKSYIDCLCSVNQVKSILINCRDEFELLFQCLDWFQNIRILDLIYGADITHLEQTLTKISNHKNSIKYISIFDFGSLINDEIKTFKFLKSLSFRYHTRSRQLHILKNKNGNK